MHKVLPTNNETWGFCGAIRHDADPAQAWPIAFTAIATATHGSDEAVRDFLDSRHGRHFADDVVNGLHAGRSLADAIDAAVKRWMAWTISARMSREMGIPRGLAYLVGLVIDCEIMAEAGSAD